MSKERQNNSPEIKFIHQLLSEMCRTKTQTFAYGVDSIKSFDEKKKEISVNYFYLVSMGIRISNGCCLCLKHQLYNFIPYWTGLQCFDTNSSFVKIFIFQIPIPFLFSYFPRLKTTAKQTLFYCKVQSNFRLIFTESSSWYPRFLFTFTEFFFSQKPLK